MAPTKQSTKTPASRRPAARASRANAKKPLCAQPPRPAPDLAPAVLANPQRARAIVVSQAKWANGTVLRYCFFTGKKYQWSVPKAQADVVRTAFARWSALGIGISVEEVQDLSEAEIRIGYLVGDGSWSAVGRDILTIPTQERTTSFGWDLTADSYGLTTAIHELGHCLGMAHEHQNPRSGIVWDEAAVYSEFSQPPNSWDHQTILDNIVKKLSLSEVQGSKWDPDSIMEYEFGPGLITAPANCTNGVNPPGTISVPDKKWALKWYPGGKHAHTLLEPLVSSPLNLAAGEQANFTLKPTETRKYSIATLGGGDTVLVLYEDIDGTPRYVAGDDDSGTERNASIEHKLWKGRTYTVRLRVNYPGQSGQTAVIYS